MKNFYTLARAQVVNVLQLRRLEKIISNQHTAKLVESRLLPGPAMSNYSVCPNTGVLPVIEQETECTRNENRNSTTYCLCNALMAF